MQLHTLLAAKIALDRTTSPTSAYFHPTATDNDMDLNQTFMRGQQHWIEEDLRSKQSGKLLKCLLFVDIRPIRDKLKQEAIKRCRGGKMQGLAAYNNMLVTDCNRSRSGGWGGQLLT